VRRWLTRRRIIAAILVVAGLALAARVDAQFFRTFRSTRFARPADYDGTFQFCRVVFDVDPRGDGGDWSVDFPRADINLSIRLSELTKTTVGRAAAGDPDHLVIRLTDDMLFQCPFIMMTEVGSAGLDDDEVDNLRKYLLKGGFLWADDFWGTDAFEYWRAELERVLPDPEYRIVDLTPGHPIFRMLFEFDAIPQIPSINHWYRSGGETSELGYDSAEVHLRAITDARGRVMVLITHNTDIADAWEREAQDPRYFYLFSPKGYAVGINILLYAISH
jgi:uncharacterized protein DUF4159